MKFGLSFLPDAAPHTKSASDYFREAVNLSCFAEDIGFSTIKMTEHYLHPYGGYCPNPLIFLSAVAARTTTIRLMTGCILPAFHHPIQIAAETALVDALSNGRLDVGFGRAYLPYEFDAFGINLDESRDRYNASILAVLDLWKNEYSTAKTSFFNYENVTSLPRPHQFPYPPIWGAAVTSRQSFAWLGEQGMNLLVTPPFGGLEELLPYIEIYKSSFGQHHPDKLAQVAISLPLMVCSTQGEALKQSDCYLSNYLKIWADAVKAWDSTTSSDYLRYGGLAKLIRGLTPEKMRNNLQAIVGTPEVVNQQIATLSDLLQVDQILWQIDYGCQPYDVAFQSLNLFAKSRRELYVSAT